MKTTVNSTPCSRSSSTTAVESLPPLNATTCRTQYPVGDDIGGFSGFFGPACRPRTGGIIVRPPAGAFFRAKSSSCASLIPVCVFFPARFRASSAPMNRCCLSVTAGMSPSHRPRDQRRLDLDVQKRSGRAHHPPPRLRIERLERPHDARERIGNLLVPSLPPPLPVPILRVHAPPATPFEAHCEARPSTPRALPCQNPPRASPWLSVRKTTISARDSQRVGFEGWDGPESIWERNRGIVGAGTERQRAAS